MTSLLPALEVRFHRDSIEALLDGFFAVKQEVAEGEGDDRAVEDEGATDAGAETEVQHAAAFVAAERLHAGVVHDSHGALEGGGIVEVDPAVAEIEWIGDRVAMADIAGIADRDAVEFPIGGGFVHFFNQKLGRERFAGRKFQLLLFATRPDFDVRATDIDHEYVHSRLAVAEGNHASMSGRRYCR